MSLSDNARCMSDEHHKEEAKMRKAKREIGKEFSAAHTPHHHIIKITRTPLHRTLLNALFAEELLLLSLLLSSFSFCVCNVFMNCWVKEVNRTQILISFIKICPKRKQHKIKRAQTKKKCECQLIKKKRQGSVLRGNKLEEAKT